MTLSVADAERLAVEAETWASNLIEAVRTMSRTRVSETLTALDVYQLRALAIVLAAMHDPDELVMRQALRWTHGGYLPALTAEQAIDNRKRLAAAIGSADDYQYGGRQ